VHHSQLKAYFVELAVVVTVPTFIRSMLFSSVCLSVSNQLFKQGVSKTNLWIIVTFIADIPYTGIL